MKLVAAYTGTQKGMAAPQRDRFYRLVETIAREVGEFHHGDCIGGDSEAHGIVSSITKWWINIHPAVNAGPKRAHRTGPNVMMTWDEKPPLVRNQIMVECCHFLLATPQQMAEPERLRAGGTWYTIRHARKEGKPIIIVWPNGTIKIEGTLPDRLSRKVAA